MLIMILYWDKNITKKSQKCFSSVAKIPHGLACDPREVDVVCVVDRVPLGMDFRRVLNFNSAPGSYFLLQSPQQ